MAPPATALARLGVRLPAELSWSPPPGWRHFPTMTMYPTWRRRAVQQPRGDGKLPFEG